MTMTTSAPRARPKAILFDLDDTLWPIGPVIARAETSLHAWLAVNAPRVAERFSIEALRARRISLLAEQPHRSIDLGMLRRAGLCEAFAHADEDVGLVDAAMVHFLAWRNAVEPYPDVLPALARLKSDYALGTISNGNADLDAIGLAHHFQVSLSAARFGVAKPDAAIFHAACQMLGTAPHETLYVGDDILLDVRAAQQAGLGAVWLRRGVSDAHLVHGVTPEALCADLDGLLRWLGHPAVCA